MTGEQTAYLYRLSEALNAGYMDFRGERRSIFLTAKEKIRELVLNRINGTDKPFKYVLGDDEFKLFSSPKTEEQGWETDGMYAACEDIEDAAGIQFSGMAGLSEALSAISYAYEDSPYGCFERTETDRESLKDYMDYIDCEGTDEELIDELMEMLSAIEKAEHGLYEEALSNQTLYELVEGINNCMNNIYPTEYILQHMELFLPVLAESCPDNPVYLTYFRSDELYWYEMFKDKVPENERVDHVVEIYEDPMIGMVDAQCFDTLQTHLITVCYQGGNGVSAEDIGMFWKDARDYLRMTLPKLRHRYYEKETGSLLRAGALFLHIL